MDAYEAFSLLASAGRSGLPFLLKPVWISDLNLLAETHLGLRLHQSNTRPATQTRGWQVGHALPHKRAAGSPFSVGHIEPSITARVGTLESAGQARVLHV